jgi:hypothetical protein
MVCGILFFLWPFTAIAAIVLGHIAWSGYDFFYMPQVDSDGLVTKYILAADPTTPGTWGVRHFFTDQSGVIRYKRRQRSRP